MTLYHYTTLDNFFSIWESKTLWFSYSKDTNDYFEREKTYVFCQDTFTYKGKPLDRTYFKGFREGIIEELDRYRQVSFCLNYSRKIPGYASPMMWGQYARSKSKEGIWKDGVCLALDSEKLIRPTSTFFERKVNYSDNVKPPFVRGIDFTRKDAAEAVRAGRDPGRLHRRFRRLCQRLPRHEHRRLPEDGIRGHAGVPSLQQVHLPLVRPVSARAGGRLEQPRRDERRAVQPGRRDERPAGPGIRR